MNTSGSRLQLLGSIFLSLAFASFMFLLASEGAHSQVLDGIAGVLGMLTLVTLCLTFAQFVFWWIPRIPGYFDNYEQPTNDELEMSMTAERFTQTVKVRAKGGFVYLLKGQDGLYKIGHTNNPDDRLRTFNVKLPFEVKFEHLIECQDRRRSEGQLHVRFASKRVNGEWFRLDPEDVAYIKTLENL